MLTERGGRNGERYIDKKMRVLTIEPFNRLPPDARPFHNGSLGVLSLAGALKQSGFETDYLDATIGDDNPNRIANEKGLIRRVASDEQIAEKVGDYHFNRYIKYHPAFKSVVERVEDLEVIIPAKSEE